MYNPRYYDSPPVYSPPYSTTSHSLTVYPQRSLHTPLSPHHALPADSYYVEGKPQHFYRWFSPPGLVKTFKGATVLMCFLIFAFVASTLVWDMNGFGYGGFTAGTGSTGSGTLTGYYGGSYGYGSSYMTPQSAKAAMISMAAINFLVSLGFLVGSFSRSRVMRGSRFYLSIFICDIILAVLQGIIDIIFVIGVNPTSQSSQSMLYNPMLMMCQNIQGTPSLSASAGAGFPGGYPMYNQYLHHYCYMDPEEAVAFVLGVMVVFMMSFSAYYAYKTRSKIYRHGKAHVYWDQPLTRPSAPDWVSHVEDVQQAPTVVVSERAAPNLRAENSSSTVSHGNGALSIHSERKNQSRSIPTENRAEPLFQDSSSSDELPIIKKPHHHHHHPHHHHHHHMRKERSPHRDPKVTAESQYETGYTTGDTGNELDHHSKDQLYRLYPEIISDEQRAEYKKHFEVDLQKYKSVCSSMDHISDHMIKLSTQLNTLEDDSTRYQEVSDQYNKLKELKRTTDYQEKKKQSKELRQKLFHIKRLVKVYDQGLC